jgi:hypothetical protein
MAGFFFAEGWCARPGRDKIAGLAAGKELLAAKVRKRQSAEGGVSYE